MKPSFALSLSFEGIALLHRAAGGWNLVGEVPLDVPDLAAALADLRARALGIDPEGLSCKVIIPNDQIRYMQLETGQAEDDDRLRQVRQALDGATPYAVDDLAFDISIEGTLSHVAAVARDTLAEAEAFAADHGFDPVSFVAIPGDQSFLGEPFFGVAKHAGSRQIDPDGIAVVITGTAALPEPETAEPDAVEPEPAEPEPAAAEPETAAPAEPELPELADPEHPEPEHPEPEVTEPELAEPEPVVDPTPTETPTAEVVAEEPETKSEAEPEEQPEEQPKDAATDIAAPAPATPAVLAQVKPLAAPTPVGFASRRGKVEGDAQTPPPLAGVRRPEATAVAKPVTPPPAIAAASVIAASQKARKAPAAPQPVASKPQVSAGALLNRSASTSTPEKSPDKIDAPKGLGLREAPRSGGKPRFLGLILTLLLLLALAAVAAWATFFLDNGPLRSSQQTPAATSQPDLEETESAAPSTAAVPAEAIEPAADAAPGLTPEIGSLLPPLTGIDSTPELPALTATDSAVLDALRQDETGGTEMTAEGETDPELEPEPEAEPEMAAPETTQADAETLYAATGIWPNAPESPAAPEAEGGDDLYIASIDRADLSQDAVALPPSASLETDGAPNVVTSPAAAGRRFALDARGLVEATPEGNENPDGVIVTLGRPAAVPPALPTRLTTEAETAAETDALRSHLTGHRPRPRPTDLIEQTERAQLGGRSRNELGRVRARPRPKSVEEAAARAATVTAASAAAAAAAIAPDNDVSSATARAVATALVPKSRPASLPTETRSSASASIGIPSKAAAPAPAAPAPAATPDQEIDEPEPTKVAPSLPSSASVARQATVDRAINLRNLNLIGVYGSASNRRALIRLPNGRYKKVKVGDSIEGGKVIAIGDSELRYSKGGRNMTLKLPNG